MIYLGQSSIEKNKIISEYIKENNIKKVFILSPEKLYFNCDIEETKEFIEYDNIIMYVYFYRLLQEINNDVLVVINECLRTKNRYDLTYNCIRNFLYQTRHQIIFQYLPTIESFEDFFILFDFDTRSKWKGQTDCNILKNSNININQINIKLNKIEVQTGAKLKLRYQEEKNNLIEKIGLKDPHTIPRNLYLLSGKSKLFLIDHSKKYIGRNNRFCLLNMQTYKEKAYQGNYTVFEFSHNHIDFIDFLSISKQVDIDVLVADLKVDQWYFERYQKWVEELDRAYAKIRQ